MDLLAEIEHSQATLTAIRIDTRALVETITSELNPDHDLNGLFSAMFLPPPNT